MDQQQENNTRRPAPVRIQEVWFQKNDWLGQETPSKLGISDPKPVSGSGPNEILVRKTDWMTACLYRPVRGYEK